MAELLIGRQYLSEVPAIIEDAKERVRVAMFLAQVQSRTSKMTSRVMCEKLWAKAREGVDVRVLLNNAGGGVRVPAVNRDTARWLQDRGVKVKNLGPGHTCHAKFVIVDELCVVIGSHNWTPYSLRDNFEVSVLISEASTVRRLVDYFDALWEISKEF